MTAAADTPRKRGSKLDTSHFDRPVIALDGAEIPRLPDFLACIAEPADLLAGQRVGVVGIVGWTHEGDHLRLDVEIDGRVPDLAVLVRHHDIDRDAFLRSPRWNISYRGAAFDRVAEALLVEVGKRLERVAEQADLSGVEIAARFFRRPLASEFLEITSGKKLYLRVTDHCDENCVFCNATEGNSNIISSKTQLRAILDRMPASALSQVIFSGGEPTLLRALPEMVGLAYANGARDIIIQTNGVGFAAPGALDPYLPYRDRLGIGFSLHAFETRESDLLTAAHDVPKLPLTERFLQGVGLPDPERERPDSGRLAAKLQAIDRAVELGFRVKVTCVVMRPNLAGVGRFAELCWQRWGARLDRLQFSYAMPRGNAWLNPQWALSFTECVPHFLSAFALGERTGLRIETSQSATIPPCMIPDAIDHYDLYGDFSGGAVADPERVKPPHLCNGCAFDRVCAGVWQRYLDVFGEDEIRAVRDRPPPDVVLDDFIDGEVLDLI
jgi:hypothetical protein